MGLKNILRRIYSLRLFFMKDKKIINRVPTMQNSLRALLYHGVPVKSVIDIGVLTGTQPLMEVFPDIKHHLFEPVDTHFETISSNYRKLSHELHHVALSDKDGSAYLACRSIYHDDKVTHSEVVSKKVSTEDVPGLISCKEIRLAKLDSILGETDAQEPYLIKIDVDGHEMKVLKGTVDTLKKSSIIVIEAPLNKASLPHFFERSNFLLDHGFHLLDIVDLAYYDGTLWQVDLVFVRKDIVDDIDRLRPFEAASFSFDDHRWSPLSDRL